MLFLVSWFIPSLHEWPDSPAISPASVLLDGNGGPCNSAAALFAILRFACLSFVGSSFAGWLLQMIIGSVFHDREHTSDV